MKQGFYESLDPSVYHNDPCDIPSLNQSTGKLLITKSPYHARKQHPKLGGERWTPSNKMDEGSIVHSLILNQPLDGMVEVIDASDFRKDATKEKRDKARADGLFVILEKRFIEIKSGIPFMIDNLNKAGVSLDAYIESSMIWNRDCICRTRADIISKDRLTITDLKCSDDPDPGELERHIVNMCYDLQAAAEIEAVETLFPETIGRIKFEDVFILTEEPWFVVAVEHSESLLELGRRRWSRAKSKWIECLSSGKWDGYPNRITGHAPNWAIKKEFGEVA